MTDSASRGQRLSESAKRYGKLLGAEALGEVMKLGYDPAARLSTGLLGHHIEKLHEKTRSGGKLSPSEQYLLTTLTDIKAEMERELEYQWERYVRP